MATVFVKGAKVPTTANGNGSSQAISLTSDKTFKLLVSAISAFPNLRLNFVDEVWQARVDAIYGRGICWYEAVGESSNPNAALVDLGHKLINAFVSFKRPGHTGRWYARWHEGMWMMIREDDVPEVAGYLPEWDDVRADFQRPGYKWPGG